MRVYHICGYPLWAEIGKHERTQSTLYRDDDDQSDTYGDEVIHCPGCNAWLSEKQLYTEPQEQV
jgi:hypothetical protein